MSESVPRILRIDSPGDQWINEIAPLDANLPCIMTHYSPTERDLALTRFAHKKKHGTGFYAVGKQARPGLSMRSERYNQQYELKGRKKNAGTILAAHLALLAIGSYPSEQRSVCSHLCHNNMCLKDDHLEWSTHDDNMRRERLCRREKVCLCQLDPPCRFDCGI